MAELIDGKELSKKIRKDLKKEVANLKENGVTKNQIISINFEDADYEELQDRKKLYEYLIQKHPNISKIYIGPNNSIPLNNDEQFEYFLNPIHNTNIEELKKLKNKSKVIITLNPICPLCNNKNECGLRENLAQLNYDPQSSKNNICSFLKFKQYQLSKNRKIEADKIIKLYNEIGFNHFFIEEYPSIHENIEEYLFFLIKPEYYQPAKDFLNEFIKR